MYAIEIEDAVDKALKKLAKKDKKQLEAVSKKVEQILNDPTILSLNVPFIFVLLRNGCDARLSLKP